jgi:hypothetical protein
MENTQYNGWQNYATWRINLEWIDGDGKRWYDDYSNDVREMREAIKEYVEEELLLQVADEDASATVYSYALAFLTDVNWFQIAEHIVEDYHHFGCEHCGEAVEDIDDKFCSDRCKQTAINEAIGERI